MSTEKINLDLMASPWDEVFQIAYILPKSIWMLIGGLMIQAHAHFAGLESRATTDIDMLIDVMTNKAYIGSVISGLEKMGYTPNEPGIRGSAFHRMTKDGLTVDVLIAEHLPSRKRIAASFNNWPMMEIPGGSQALDRQMTVILISKGIEREVRIPDLLGALVLKAAAYTVDKRDRGRHLEDVAVIASLITNHANELKRLQGSDKKRLRSVMAALIDENHPAWLRLNEGQRLKGHDTLRILTR